MAYETSSDAGSKPFNPDRIRGKWASPIDFFFACIGHAFRIDAVFAVPSMIFQYVGFYALVPYTIILLVCTMPVVFLQSFLGQFSSTGFISVFRIAPFFKGIGYVSLAINLTTLTYYSIFAAIPLFYFLHSLNPTLPWSCEGKWPCNMTNIVFELSKFDPVEMPSLKFFLKHLNIMRFTYDHPKVKFSWSLVVCSILIWLSVWVVLKKSTEMIGRIMRYSNVVMLTILGICVIRFAFLPGAFLGLQNFFKPTLISRKAFLSIPLLALSGLGPGWGSILTMASYNKFKNDITKHTWILCLGQFGIMILGSLLWMFIENFLIASYSKSNVLRDSSRHWMQFMSVPSALSLMEVPQVWSLLYFAMLTLGATNLLIVQLFSVLTSLFDEYEQLRRRRKDVIQITIGILALGSSLFCSNYGVTAFVLMARYSIATQVLLNLLLLFVVLWIYGRERFQRDLHFMTNRTYSTWMVFIVRFVAPIVLLYSCLIGLFVALVESDYSFSLLIIVSSIILSPWLLIPGYCIFKIRQTTGLLGSRFKQCVRPTDWYPTDLVDRQGYEEEIGNSENAHQLMTVTEENNA